MACAATTPRELPCDTIPSRRSGMPAQPRLDVKASASIAKTAERPAVMSPGRALWRQLIPGRHASCYEGWSALRTPCALFSQSGISICCGHFSRHSPHSTHWSARVFSSSQL